MHEPSLTTGSNEDTFAEADDKGVLWQVTGRSVLRLGPRLLHVLTSTKWLSCANSSTKYDFIALEIITNSRMIGVRIMCFFCNDDYGYP